MLDEKLSANTLNSPHNKHEFKKKNIEYNRIRVTRFQQPGTRFLNRVISQLTNPDQCLTMLNKYPLVKAVFVQYNTTLPSSAAVERLFSVGLQTATAKRNQLSNSNFEKLLLLKANEFEWDDSHESKTMNFWTFEQSLFGQLCDFS